MDDTKPLPRVRLNRLGNDMPVVMELLFIVAAVLGTAALGIGFGVWLTLAGAELIGGWLR